MTSSIAQQCARNQTGTNPSWKEAMSRRFAMPPNKLLMRTVSTRQVAERAQDESETDDPCTRRAEITTLM
jgi:hypothetical protein